MHNTIRTAGTGLLVFGLGSVAAFSTSGSPGGDYASTLVTDYTASSHWPTAFVVAYVGAFAALGLFVFGNAVRTWAGTTGELLRGLSFAGATASVVGWFIVGGLDVAMAEGGPQVQAGVPHPVVYTITEIGNLLAVCSPAFFVGVVAILLGAKGPLPGWLRGFSYLAGVCGVLAPFFFTYFIFVLWAIVAGVCLVATKERASAMPQESLV
ncbi:MAG TPA: hypothetical protein VFJ19_05230 [Nocardioidaceae bacterium]|nr:hypothetical protein [Nocardioidaceae bacterium]